MNDIPLAYPGPIKAARVAYPDDTALHALLATLFEEDGTRKPDPVLVKGGQGRSDRETLDTALVAFCCIEAVLCGIVGAVIFDALMRAWGG